MGLFKPVTAIGPAYLKCGIMGFTGTGKTYTAGEIARGFWKLLVERKILDPKIPVNFIDTETGSDYEAKRFKSQGVPFWAFKTRAFEDLVSAIDETSKQHGILMIDSITHFWRELCESYAIRRHKKRLGFEDWAYLKSSDGWGKYADRFINAPCHILMCGRAGYEYDFFKDEETEKNELHKTGVKMKVEGETGYEPSLLILMDRRQESERDKDGVETIKVYRTATILKDRCHDMDGMLIRDPKFEDFMPFINNMDLGGQHVGIDLSRTSVDMIPEDKRAQYKKQMEKREIVLDEVKNVISKHIVGRSQGEQDRKATLLETHFGTRSWKKVESLTLDAVETGRNTLWQELEGQPYHYPKPGGEPPVTVTGEQLPDFEASPPNGLPNPTWHEPVKESEPAPVKQAEQPKQDAKPAAPPKAGKAAKDEPKQEAPAKQSPRPEASRSPSGNGDGPNSELGMLIESEITKATTLEDLQEAWQMMEDAFAANDLPSATLGRLRRMYTEREQDLKMPGVQSGKGDLF